MFLKLYYQTITTSVTFTSPTCALQRTITLINKNKFLHRVGLAIQGHNNVFPNYESTEYVHI